MIYGMHFHISDRIIIDKEEIEGKIVTVKEGYKVFSFDSDVKVKNRGNKFFGKVRILATIQTRIAFLKFLENLPIPIINLLKEAGYHPRNSESLEEANEWLKNILVTENPEKKNLDWVTIIIASDANSKFNRKTEDFDFHVHTINPVIVYPDAFLGLTEGKVGFAIEEGHRIFDLNNPTEVINISGLPLGQAQVLATIQTKISNLPSLNFPDEEIIIKEAGYFSRTMLRRELKHNFSKKSDPDWITIIAYIPKIILVNR